MLLRCSSSFFLLSKRSKAEILLYRFCFRWCCCLLFLLWRIAKASSVIALVLAIPAIAGRWINHFRPDLVPPPVFLVAGLALIAFVVANLLALRFARAFGKHRSAVCEHLGLSDARFVVDNGLLARGPGDARGAFSFNTAGRTKQTMAGFDAFYFSFITLSTVGYGDITPVSRIARWLAAMEAMTGSLYVAVLIARLVALYRSGEEKFHVGNSTPKSDDS